MPYSSVDEDEYDLLADSSSLLNYQQASSSPLKKRTSTTYDGQYLKGKCASYADRVLFSTWYYTLYILVIMVNLTLIIWLLIMLARDNYSVTAHWIFISLDVLVNVAFMSEVSLQVISQKKEYFKHLSNLFDFVVMLLSLATLVMYVEKTDPSEEVEDLVALILIVVRYVLQFLRLISIIKKHRSKVISRKEVDFSQLKPEDFHFMETEKPRNETLRV